MRRSGLILFFLLIVLSCKKNIVKVNEAFIGTWSGTGPSFTVEEYGDVVYHFEFNIDGSGKYTRKSIIITTEKEGKAKIRKDKLRLGSKHFDIQSHPTFVSDSLNGHYEMMIDSILYIRN